MRDELLGCLRDAADALRMANDSGFALGASVWGASYIGAFALARSRRVWEGIVINGVCLTVVDHCGSTFALDISPETLRATNLRELRPGDGVNLERSLWDLAKNADSLVGSNQLEIDRDPLDLL